MCLVSMVSHFDFLYREEDRILSQRNVFFKLRSLVYLKEELLSFPLLKLFVPIHYHLQKVEIRYRAQKECNLNSTYQWEVHKEFQEWFQELNRIYSKCTCKLFYQHNKRNQNQSIWFHIDFYFWEVCSQVWDHSEWYSAT